MIWRLLFLGVYVLFFLIRSLHGSKDRNDGALNEYLESQNLAAKREGKVSTKPRTKKRTPAYH